MLSPAPSHANAAAVAPSGNVEALYLDQVRANAALHAKIDHISKLEVGGVGGSGNEAEEPRPPQRQGSERLRNAQQQLEALSATDIFNPEATFTTGRFPSAAARSAGGEEEEEEEEDFLSGSSIFSVYKSFDEFCSAQLAEKPRPPSQLSATQGSDAVQERRPSVAGSVLSSASASGPKDITNVTLPHGKLAVDVRDPRMMDRVERLMRDSAELAAALKTAALLNSAVDTAIAAHSTGAANIDANAVARNRIAGADSETHNYSTLNRSTERLGRALEVSDLDAPPQVWGQPNHEFGTASAPSQHTASLPRTRFGSHDPEADAAPALPFFSTPHPPPSPRKHGVGHTSPLVKQAYGTAGGASTGGFAGLNNRFSDRELEASSSFVAAPASNGANLAGVMEMPLDRAGLFNSTRVGVDASIATLSPAYQDDHNVRGGFINTYNHDNARQSPFQASQTHLLTALFQGYMVRFLMRSKKLKTLRQQIFDVEQTLEDTVQQFMAQQEQAEAHGHAQPNDRDAAAEWTRQFVVDLRAQVRAAKEQLHAAFFRRGVKTEFFQSLRVAHSVREQKQKSASLHRSVRPSAKAGEHRPSPGQSTKPGKGPPNRRRSPLPAKSTPDGSSNKRSDHSRPQLHTQADTSTVHAGTNTQVVPPNDSFIPGAIRIEVVEARDLVSAALSSVHNPSPSRGAGVSPLGPYCQPQATVVLRNRLNGNESREFKTKIGDGPHPAWRFNHKFALRSRLSNYDFVVRVRNCDRFISERASGLGGVEIPLASLVRGGSENEADDKGAHSGAGTALYGDQPHVQWFTLKRLRRGERIGGSICISLTCLRGNGAPRTQVSPPGPQQRSVSRQDGGPPVTSPMDKSARADGGHVQRKGTVRRAGSTHRDENRGPGIHGTNKRHDRRSRPQTRAGPKPKPFLKRTSQKIAPKKVDWSSVQSKTDTHRTGGRRRVKPDATHSGHGAHLAPPGQEEELNMEKERSTHDTKRRSPQKNRQWHAADSDDDDAHVSGQMASEIPRWNGRRWERGGSRGRGLKPQGQTQQHQRSAVTDEQRMEQDHASSWDGHRSFDELQAAEKAAEIETILSQDYATTRQFLFPSSAPPVAEGSFYGDDVETIDGSSHGSRSDDEDHQETSAAHGIDGDIGAAGSERKQAQSEKHFSHDSYEMYKDLSDDYEDEYQPDDATALQEPTPTARGRVEASRLSNDSESLHHPHRSQSPMAAAMHQKTEHVMPSEVASDPSGGPTEGAQRLQVEELESLFDHLTRMSTGTAAGSTYADSVNPELLFVRNEASSITQFSTSSAFFHRFREENYELMREALDMEYQRLTS